MNSREILANYVLSNVGESSLIDMAVEALTEGYDSKSLRILSGENKTHFNVIEIRQLFKAALTEINIALPSPEEAAHTLICYWARCIIDGTVSPRDGAYHINYDVYMRLPTQPNESYVGESIGMGLMIGLQYQYDDLEEGHIEYNGKSLTVHEARKILNDDIFTEASRYLEKCCGLTSGSIRLGG
jgi:hypothetical protein